MLYSVSVLERWPRGRRRRFAKPLYGLNRIEGSNPSLSARFFEENFSHRHCEHSEAIQKPQYLRGFRLSLDPYLTFSNFAILPPKSPFLFSPSQVHENTWDEGKYIRGPFIYLSFQGLMFFAHAFFRERSPG